MNRRLRGTSILAAAAGLAVPAATLAQEIDISNPETDSDEFFAEGSVIHVDVPAGLDAAGTFSAGVVTFSLQVFTIDSAGDVVNRGSAITVDNANDVDADNDGTFDDGFTYADAADIVGINLANVGGFDAAVGFARSFVGTTDADGDTVLAVGLNVIADSAGGGTANPISLISGANPAPSLEPDNSSFVAAVETPFLLPTLAIENVFVQTSGSDTSLFFVFNNPINVDNNDGAGAQNGNNENQTIATGAATPLDASGSVADADIRVDDDNDFSADDATAINPTSALQIIGPDVNVLEVTGLTANASPLLTAGNFAAIENPNVADIGGQLASDITTDNTITTVTNLAITGVEWTSPTVARVTFNNPLATTPSADYFIFQNSSGTDLGATGVSVAGGPTASQLDVTITGFADPTLEVVADGDLFDTDTSSDTDSSNLDGTNVFLVADENAGTTDADDIFGTDLGGTGSDVASTPAEITDGIQPTNAPVFAYIDVDNNGVVETLAIIFDEPVSITGGTPALADFNVDLVPSQSVLAIENLNPFGEYPTPLPQTQDVDEFDPTALAEGQDGIFSFTDPARLATGSAIYLTIDPAAINFTGDGNGVNAPGTNPETGSIFTLDHPAFMITDGTSEAVSIGAGTDVNIAADRARPAPNNFWFFTGENINNPTPTTPPTNITQFLNELGGVADIGPTQTNDLLAIVFGETVAAANDFEDLLDIDGAPFNATGADTTAQPGTAGTGAEPNNILVLQNIASEADNDFADDDQLAANDDLLPGASITYNATDPTGTDSGGGTGIELPTDAAGNEIAIPSTPATLVDRSSAFTNLLDDNEGGVLDSAFLLDNDDDLVADQILVQTSAAIDTTGSFTDAFNDFSVTGVSGVTITGISEVPGNPSSFFLDLGGSNVSINATNLNLVYDGAQAFDPDSDGDNADSRILTTLSGNPLSPVTSTLTNVEQVQQLEDGPFIAVQTFEGAAELSAGTPFPVGTEIRAYLGVPVVRTINADHNNIDFVYDIRGRSSGAPDQASIEAFVNFLYGVEPFVYLTRQDTNTQTFTNSKDGVNGGSDDFEFAREIIQVNVNANNLSNITITGSGETGTSNRLTGNLSLCWDVLRSEEGTLSDFFTNGYGTATNDGLPVIVGQSVITDTSGNFTIDVTAPNARFNARSLIDFEDVGQPIFFLAVQPSGVVTPLSSLNRSIDINNPVYGRGPILFQANNTQQDSDDTAPDITPFNINLDNASLAWIFPDWNLLSHSVAAGFAQGNNDVPELPSGIADADIQIGTPDLVLDDAFDQFFYWLDTNGNGVFNRSELDAGSFFIDEDCFDNFTFVADSDGVDLNGDAFVGGYAAGFFSGLASNIGATQFGPPLDQASIFPSADTFPNNSSTEGWGAFTLTDSNGYADAAAVLAANPGLDAFIIYDNDEDGILTIFNSLSTNDSSGSIEPGTTIFGHYED